jgi:glyoxylase-like metal-dependent hydrolase (beta-lactamase superfamily II)
MAHEFKKINDNIYYLTSCSNTDRPILGLITGRKRNLIIDSGNSGDHADLLLSNIQKYRLSKQETFIVTTHWHWDHVFGAYFMPYPLISHEKTYDKLQEIQMLEWSISSLDQRVRDGQEIEFCAEMMKREYNDLSEIRIRIPDIQFHTRLKIGLGGIDCIIENIGGDHSQDSTVVYIVQPKVLFLGDCLGANIYIPKWEYQPKALIKLVRKIKSYQANLYFESHSEPIKAEEFLLLLNSMEELAKYTIEEKGIKENIQKVFIEKHKRNLTDDDNEVLTNLINGWLSCQAITGKI